jgi:hypothetical protein
MPLPKRGPHLRKRPPSARPRARGHRRPELSRAGGRAVGRQDGVAQRRPGRAEAQARARERAKRPGEAASPTGPRSSTQSPHHTKSRQNRTDRPTTDARLRLQPPVPTPDSSPALSPPPSASPRWSTHRSQIRHQSTHHNRPCPVAAAPPPAHQHPPGQTRTTFTWHVEEGGSGAKRRTPLPPKPRREAKERSGAGRRPVALRAETHRAKQMERNTRRETAQRQPRALSGPGSSFVSSTCGV